MHRCFGAKLLKTEMDINYYPYGSKKTDYLIQIYGKTVAVSVTRAMKFSGTFTNFDAKHLLMKKLDGINWSTRNGQDKWEKQILHVWTNSQKTAEIINYEFEHTMTDELRTNTVLFITITKNAPWLYSSRNILPSWMSPVCQSTKSDTWIKSTKQTFQPSISVA